MHGSYGGFDYAAREARRELLEEARKWHLARLARRSREGLRDRTARLMAGFWRLIGPPVVKGSEKAVEGTPDFVYLMGETHEDTAVEVYLGGDGCIVRKTDLRTGASTDAFVADGRVRP